MNKSKIKKISFILLMTSSFFLFSTNSSAIKNTSNYIATPGGGAIYSDEEFMKIRVNQEERFKKEKIYLEKLKKEKQKKENKIKLEKLKKDFNAQINHINNMINIEGVDKCKVITKKTYNSLNMKQYEINTLKDSIGMQKTNFRKGYYYNPDNNTCIETQNFIGNNIFPSRESCNICLKGQNTNSGINVVARVEPVKTTIKKAPIKIYSDASLSIIADNIIKNKNNAELVELKTRAENLINTLENGQVNIKESTKINFLKLLKILDKNILAKTYSQAQEKNIQTKTIKTEIKQEEPTIQTTNSEEEDDTMDFMKNLFGDDF